MEQTYNPINNEEFHQMMVGYPAKLIEGYYIQDYHDGISLEDDHKTIKNCKSQSLIFDPLICGSIIFYNCIIDDLQFYDSSIDRIVLVNCQIKRLLFQNLKKNTEISISTNLKEGTPQRIEMIIIKGGQPNLSITNVDFHSLEFTTSGQQGSLQISDCNQNNDTSVDISGNIKSIKSISSKYATFNINSNNDLIVLFQKVTILDSCLISVSYINNLSFSQSEIKALSIQADQISTVEITDGYYSFAHINGYVRKEILIKKFMNNIFKINILSLSGNIVDSSARLNLRELLINDLQLNHIKNYGSIEISDTTINNCLEIESSQMGETQFRNVSLSTVRKFKILKSSLTECRFSSIDWTVGHKIYELPNSNYNEIKAQTDHKRSIKEIYRQLKVVTSKESNRFDEIMFQAHEQRLQKEILVLDNKKSDALLLQIHHYINEYNLNYWKPIRLLLLTHTILFILGVTFSDSLSFQIWSFWKGFSLKELWDCIGTFFMTMFPFHSRDYMADGDGIIKIVDTLMTLFSGVFLFYFALATRKFHVKG